MPNDFAADVLVVGAGPTGLFLAAELSRHGLSCRLVERLAKPLPLSRAVGVHSRTMEVFEQVGVIDDFLQAALRTTGFAQYAGGSRLVRVNFAGVDAPYPFVACLQQDRTEPILERHMNRAGVKAERAVELTGLTQDADGVTATLRHDGRDETVRTRWLVGCDGSHSAVRHAVGLPFEGAAYPNVFALADVHLDWPYPHDEVSVFHHPDGVTAAFPLPDPGRYRLVFDVSRAFPAESAARGENVDHGPAVGRLPPPTLEDVRRLVADRVSPKAVADDPRWLAHFRIHCRQVPRYRSGRAFLAGDAAHIHSPVGGQGMNTGLQDAFNLAWKLALATRGRAADGLLDSYSEERHAIGKQVLATTDRGTKLLTTTNPFVRLLRNVAMRLLPAVGPVRSALLRGMMQLSLNYRGASLVTEAGGPRGGPRAGDRAPDADLGGRRLFQLAAGTTGHHLLVFADAGRAGALTAALGDLVAAGLVVPHVVGVSLPDPAGALRKRYGVGRGEGVYLIRPDGYVGYRAGRADAAPLLAHLRKVVK